ncbi:MAG: phosphatidylinositol alpha-mannosyltransferase [Ilumatobacter coccineus]|uniref:Phosphatidylinositol alpha-mannosyltransferase n=1 Tax=Ilumatobacter coccineus TaxID=467094 RepID=A0A2G6KF28_9ACTN|nr:MAG: phosphatidylinositol alpha-mannosyltransferase [Ilumatobacter coccineus]
MTATTDQALKVAMVCPYSVGVPGGVQIQAIGLARELQRMGHEVDVLTLCDGPTPDPVVIPLGKSLPMSANGSVALISLSPLTAVRVRRALRQGDYDVVHIHEPLIPAVSHMALMGKCGPKVGTFHAAGVLPLYRLFAPALRWMLKRLDYRVAVSKDARALVETTLGGSYETLFNGIEQAEFEAAIPHPATRPTIFFLGRHEERKGLGVLLDAISKIDLDIACWIGGVGPDTDELKKRYGDDDRLEWLGRIDEADKLARLRGASVFCAPSLYGESFGIVLLEGMAALTPVVASRLDGYQNVATDGVDALLVPPGDADALAEALVKVLTDHDLADRLAAAGRERARQLSMEELASRYVEIYRQVLARRATS